MKVLYAIQATGNGHLSRAKEIVPVLENRVNVDLLVSGTQGDIELPHDIKYSYKGFSFIFGNKGGVDIFATIKKAKIFRVIKEIRSCPVSDYDLVINDFEPISAWACKLRGVNCISLSHQSALLSKKVPQPKNKSSFNRFILKYYAPSIQSFGFHFKRYDSSIYLPIIRQAIRRMTVVEENHYTVYLPAYKESKICAILNMIPEVNWHVFSKKCKQSYRQKNVSIFPITAQKFEKSIASCKGVICGAGFETPAEAMFLKKKLLVIPMKGQFEQHYNAAGLRDCGVPSIKSLKKKYLPEIKNWVETASDVEVDYPDTTVQIVDAVLSKYIIANELSQQLLHEI
ncbi:MAG: glycosyltransferase family protein [Flavicella sp.]